MRRRTEEEIWTYGRAPTPWTFCKVLNVPAQSPTRGHPFCSYSEKPPHFSRLSRRAWGYGGPILVLHPRVSTLTCFRRVTKQKVVLLSVYNFESLIDLLLKMWCQWGKLSGSYNWQNKLKYNISSEEGVGQRFIFVIEIKDTRGFYLNSQERTVGSVSVKGLFVD